MIPNEIIVLKDRQSVIFQYENGSNLVLSAYYLRLKSPSAKNKNLREKIVPSSIKVLKIQEIGNYAIRISFSDNHSTGIYSWEYIFKIGKENSASTP